MEANWCFFAQISVCYAVTHIDAAMKLKIVKVCGLHVRV